MGNKAALLELEKQLEFWVGNLFVEKMIGDNEHVVASHIEKIKGLLEEIRHFKLIE